MMRKQTCCLPNSFHFRILLTISVFKTYILANLFYQKETGQIFNEQQKNAYFHNTKTIAIDIFNWQMIFPEPEAQQTGELSDSCNCASTRAAEPCT